MIRPMGTTLRLTLAAFSLAIAAPSAGAAVTVYSDGTFVPADWSLTLHTTGNGGTSTVNQIATGGNLANYRQVNITANTGPSFVIGVHLHADTIYDPAVLGAIINLDYTEDYRYFSGPSLGQLAGPAMVQDGIAYRTDGFVTPSPSAWVTQTVLSLAASDFFRIDGLAGTPDFSIAGDPIQFGFVRGNGQTVGAGYSTSVGIDNWAFTITSSEIPEPATLVLLAPVAMLLSDRRRRGYRTSLARQ